MSVVFAMKEQLREAVIPCQSGEVLQEVHVYLLERFHGIFLQKCQALFSRTITFS